MGRLGLVMVLGQPWHHRPNPKPLSLTLHGTIWIYSSNFTEKFEQPYRSSWCVSYTELCSSWHQSCTGCSTGQLVCLFQNKLGLICLSPAYGLPSTWAFKGKRTRIEDEPLTQFSRPLMFLHVFGWAIRKHLQLGLIKHNLQDGLLSLETWCKAHKSQVESPFSPMMVHQCVLLCYNLQS